MNAIQKATFAASALAITIIGAALVTAPLAFARPVVVVAHSDYSTPSLQLARNADLVALNRR